MRVVSEDKRARNACEDAVLILPQGSCENVEDWSGGER